MAINNLYIGGTKINAAYIGTKQVLQIISAITNALTWPSDGATATWSSDGAPITFNVVLAP